MNLPRFIDNLHVRATALFLGLLVVVGTVYYLWMTQTVFAPPAQDPAEELWFSELAESEIDSLAGVASTAGSRLADLAVDYGRGIDGFDAEVVFFDLAGRVVASSSPDSLSRAVGNVDPRLLADMTADDWAFDEIYPDPSNIDAYVNRIFHVAAIVGPDGSTGYIAATWRPLIFTEEDVALDPKKLWLQAVLVALVGSFVVGWVLMGWLTRRIKVLSDAVSSVAAGQLEQRVHDNSRDDLGRLGSDFNVMAERIETLVEDLRGKERFQRQLIANISHDLRTPLASVGGYIETLSLRGRDLAEPEYRRYLRIIADNLKHLDRLVDQLLQLSRLDAGQTRFSPEEFPLPELIEGVLARSENAAARKGITLQCDSQDDLPMVNADPLQIAQVLQNLVENGVKFGREGGRVTVVAIAHAPASVSVHVQDDGPGIAPENLPYIFERFYTADPSRSQKGQSSGLGLAISSKLVEAHGSTLTVETEPDRGACFSFDLDAVQDQELRTHRAEG